MPDLLYLLLGLLGAGLAIAVVVRNRRPALPSGTPSKVLPSTSAERSPPAAPDPDAQPADSRDNRTSSRPVPLPLDKPGARSAAWEGDDAGHEQRVREADRYRKGLAKTRSGFVARLSRLLRGKPKVDDALREQIEEVLFTADIGAVAAETLLRNVTEVLDRDGVADADAVWGGIREAARALLTIDAPPLNPDPEIKPYVLLIIGVNGVGKTTTLGKLAAQHVAAGRRVLLVAGDTFRAAAVEQLEVWATRTGSDLHRGADRADPSSVIFDGIARGRRDGYDVVLCDTAGRLHTRTELMDELAKVGRAAAKALTRGLSDSQAASIDGAHDTFLVLDATIGQNALAQARLFKETMPFTGLVVTKLDGTAKGGVVLGICDALGVPIRYVGIGEGVDDLRPFDPQQFTDALLAREDDDAVSAPN